MEENWEVMEETERWGLKGRGEGWGKGRRKRSGEREGDWKENLTHAIFANLRALIPLMPAEY